jgi:hypothetical protein
MNLMDRIKSYECEAGQEELVKNACTAKKACLVRERRASDQEQTITCVSFEGVSDVS